MFSSFETCSSAAFFRATFSATLRPKPSSSRWLSSSCPTLDRVRDAVRPTSRTPWRSWSWFSESFFKADVSRAAQTSSLRHTGPQQLRIRCHQGAYPLVHCLEDALQACSVSPGDAPSEHPLIASQPRRSSGMSSRIASKPWTARHKNGIALG